MARLWMSDQTPNEQPAMPTALQGFDARPPQRIAELVEAGGIRKAHRGLLPTALLGFRNDAAHLDQIDPPATPGRMLQNIHRLPVMLLSIVRERSVNSQAKNHLKNGELHENCQRKQNINTCTWPFFRFDVRK